jgi:rod shape determining protein RodA
MVHTRTGEKRMRSVSVFSIDFVLIVASLCLMVIGILFIFSSGVTSTGVVVSNEYQKQIIWVLTGMVLLFFFALLDYNRLNDSALYVYIGGILLLIFTLLFGKVVYGAKSWLGIWIFGIQPSEFTKITTIIFLASYLAKAGKRIEELPCFIGAFIIILIPMFFILLQPDFGTAIVYIPVFMIMTFMAGTKLRYLFFIILTGGVLVLFTMITAWETYLSSKGTHFFSLFSDIHFAKYAIAALVVIAILSLVGYFSLKKAYYYWIFFLDIIVIIALVGSLVFWNALKDYQIMRLVVFLDPAIDPRGAGWHIIQSITAVGSGGFTGKGLLKGTQSQYRFLPKQSTDFIFSIIAEEWGFIGGIVVFSLFLVIIIRSLMIMSYAKNNFATYVIAGIIGMFFFHFLVNVGMTLGIMPITGIPLFFLSYGGSSLWTAVTGIGIILSVYNRRYR